MQTLLDLFENVALDNCIEDIDPGDYIIQVTISEDGCLSTELVPGSGGDCCCDCDDPVTVTFTDFENGTDAIYLGNGHYLLVGTATIDGTTGIGISFVVDSETFELLPTSCVIDIYSIFFAFAFFDDGYGDSSFPVSYLGGTFDPDNQSGTIIVCGQAMADILTNGFDTEYGAGGGFPKFGELEVKCESLVGVTYTLTYVSGPFDFGSESGDAEIGVTVIDLPPGDYEVQVSAPGYLSITINETISLGVTQRVDVCLVPEI